MKRAHVAKKRGWTKDGCDIEWTFGDQTIDTSHKVTVWRISTNYWLTPTLFRRLNRARSFDEWQEIMMRARVRSARSYTSLMYNKKPLR